MRKLLFLMIAAITAVSAMAAPVDVVSAQKRAKVYLSELYAGKMMAPSALNPVLLKTEYGDLKMMKPVYYIFNTSSTYLVVAGDDRAEEILMVGDAPLKDINNLPPGMIDMLDQYKEEIQFLHEHPGVVVQRMSELRSATSLRAVTYGPLLTAMWDQEAPYWNQCKFNYSGTTYQCLTGCPATSASMVLYFWKYPASVGALSSYTNKLDITSTTSVNYTYPALDPVTFDWDNMKDTYWSYNSTQANAVATLMRYVGQAERMMYGTDGSGIYAADNYRIANMFKQFGYESTARSLMKSSYDEDSWATLIQTELAEGRPIVYTAVSTSGGGHAFNVDGYRESDNKYHVNWGWSGSGNNWFVMNSFATGGYSFTNTQQAVVGIQPPGAGGPPVELAVDPTSLSFESVNNAVVTKTITVTGSELKDDVTVAYSGHNYFSVSPSTLTAAEVEAGATITVTYSPQFIGTHIGTVTLSTPGTENLTVSLQGTCTSKAVINVNPTSLEFNTLVGESATQTIAVTGTKLTNIVMLSVEGSGFSINKSNMTASSVNNNGNSVDVTFRATTPGTYTGTLTLSCSVADTVVVPLTAVASVTKFMPEMLPANEVFINLTKFRADWTDETPDQNVVSYTLEVSSKAVEPVEPEVELIASLSGSSYTGTYRDITLPAPWGGTSVRGGNSAIYFRNYYQGSSVAGNITYTIPEGYNNSLFTMTISTTNSSSDGVGNLTVGTPQTADVTHYFTANHTYSWVVRASSGEKITVSSPDPNFSPNMAKLEVYTGDATAVTLNASETGDATYRLITDITDKFYTVENLTAEGTFLYKVKAIYIDGTESEWSNEQEVTLFDNGHGFNPGDLNHDGIVNITDVTILINAVLGDNEVCPLCADFNGDGVINITDVTNMLGYLSELVQLNAPRPTNTGK